MSLISARCLALAVAFIAGCGGGVVQRVDAVPTAPPGFGFVEMVVEPSDADLFVDGRFFGRVDGYAGGVVRLPLGQRRLTISKPGFYTTNQVVDLGAQGIKIEALLVREIVPREQKN